MRGKEGDELGLGQTIRITPAYAGKRSRSPPALRGGKDHPRVCGEKYANLTPKQQAEGSPPRMRGKDLFFAYNVPRFRITPAYAGKRES